MTKAILAVLLLVSSAISGLATAAVLADSVTMRTGATLLRSNEYSTSVVGTISSGAEGEYVTIQGFECGIPGAFFRALGGATTTAGGIYEASVPVRTKTTLRAEWKQATSPAAVVLKRAYVTLTKEEDGYRVVVQSETQNMSGKRVTIERLTGSGWRKLQTVVMKAPSGYSPYGEAKKLRFTVPKGTTLRAVLPRSQSGQCYLAGYSKLIRT